MEQGPKLSFPARYSGKCAAACGKPICVGEQVTHRGPKQTRHLACDPLGIDGRNPMLAAHMDVEVNGFAGGEYTRSIARATVLNEYLHAREYGPYRCPCGGLAWYKATFGACRCVQCGALCDTQGDPLEGDTPWPVGDPNEPVAVPSEPQPRQCPDCHVYTFNAEHTCVEYDEAHPCPECGAASVFVTVAAPGTGSGWQCRNGHYAGTCRELTPEDVV